jgi:hypothetical protein
MKLVIFLFYAIIFVFIISYDLCQHTEQIFSFSMYINYYEYIRDMMNMRFSQQWLWSFLSSGI